MNATSVMVTEISVSTAARILRTSQWTVRRLIEEGKLKGYRMGDRAWYRVDYESVVEFLKKAKG